VRCSGRLCTPHDAEDVLRANGNAVCWLDGGARQFLAPMPVQTLPLQALARTSCIYDTDTLHCLLCAVPYPCPVGHACIPCTQCTTQLLPNWCITYLLAILLTLMALRLYSKGKQTYAKETQLLLAAKAAAKERRRCLSPACDIRPTATAPEPTGASNTSVGTGLGAVPRSNGPARSSASHSNTLSRSFSRLRGSLVVGVGYEQGTSITSPGSALITPSGRSLISPAAQYQLQASEAGTAEELVDDGRGPGTVDGPDQQLPGQAIEQYMRSTLFQVGIAFGQWQWHRTPCALCSPSA
jgi:hypothetical protein